LCQDRIREKVNRASMNGQETVRHGKSSIYYVIVQGIGQQDIFHEEDDFYIILETRKSAKLTTDLFWN